MKLFGDTNKFIEGKGFERLTLKVGMRAGLTKQITAIGDLNKYNFGAPFHHCPTRLIPGQKILCRQKFLFG
jgi:hypothetical protein